MSGIEKYRGITPKLAKDVFHHQSAVIIGDVVIASGSSVWANVVIRGDVNFIRIGEKTNIQDCSVLHTTGNYPENNFQGFPLNIGNEVTIGHKSILHGCEIQNNCLVGMGTTILDGAIIEAFSMIGAGSLVPQNKVLKGGYLYFGNPIKQIRPIKKEEKQFFKISAQNYYNLSREYIL